MNDQSHMMNQLPPAMMNQPPPQVMNPIQPQIMNQGQLLGQSRPLGHPAVAQVNQSQVMMNQPMMMAKRGFKPNPNTNRKYQNPSYNPKSGNFGSMSKQPKMNRGNWKGKKVPTDMRPPTRRFDQPMPNATAPVDLAGMVGYKTTNLNDLQAQNRLNPRKFYPKKKFNYRFAPYAPRNTTSFIIRAKKSGGIAELVSPCPVTPAVLPTPVFSPSREVLGDIAKEEWGVDGYGSMKGLIRLRSPGNELELQNDDEDEEGDSSESDAEKHLEVERRLDHDLSRFEMIYPNYGGFEHNNVLENRVDDQDSHITQLEEENLTLKEKLYFMEREIGDLRRRLQFLERHSNVVGDVQEEVVENGSENECEGDGSDAHVSLDAKYDKNSEGTDDISMKKVAGHEILVKETHNNVEEVMEKSIDAQMMLKQDKSEVNESARMKIEAAAVVADNKGSEPKNSEEVERGQCGPDGTVGAKQNNDAVGDQTVFSDFGGDGAQGEKDVILTKWNSAKNNS